MLLVACPNAVLQQVDPIRRDAVVARKGVPVDPFAQVVNAPVAAVEVHDRRPPRLRTQPHSGHQLVADRVAHERQLPAVTGVAKQQSAKRIDPQSQKKTVIQCALPVPVAGVDPQRFLVIMT